MRYVWLVSERILQIGKPPLWLVPFSGDSGSHQHEQECGLYCINNIALQVQKRCLVRKGSFQLELTHCPTAWSDDPWRQVSWGAGDGKGKPNSKHGSLPEPTSQSVVGISVLLTVQQIGSSWPLLCFKPDWDRAFKHNEVRHLSSEPWSDLESWCNYVLF